MVLAVALVCIAWAISGGRRRRRRPGRGGHWRVNHSTMLLERLRGVGAAGQVFAYLRKIDPFLFEELVLSCFEERAIAVTRNRRYTGDGGSDGRIVLGGETMHIQAKRYGKHINRAHVAEFLALVTRRQMKGVFVHTGRTGKGARDFFADERIDCVSGEPLIALINGEALWVHGVRIEALEKRRRARAQRRTAAPGALG